MPIQSSILRALGAGHPWRRRATLAALVIGLLIAPTVALAIWGEDYSWYEYRNPGSIRYSGANYNVNDNEVIFSPHPDADVHIMQLTLCNSSYQCYPYDEWYDDFEDPRSISYGRAKCTAYQYNDYAVFVETCFVWNG